MQTAEATGAQAPSQAPQPQHGETVGGPVGNNLIQNLQPGEAGKIPSRQEIQQQLEAYRENIESKLPELKAYMSKIKAFYDDPERGVMRTKDFPLEKIIDNAECNEKERVNRASALPGIGELDDAKKQAILAMHDFCNNNGGVFGMGRKAVEWRKIGLDAGFTKGQVMELGDSGLCGGMERFLSNRGGMITSTAFFLAHAFVIQGGDTGTQLYSYIAYRFARAMLGEAKIDELTSADISVSKKLLRIQALGSIGGILAGGSAALVHGGVDIPAIEGFKNIIIPQLIAMSAHELFALRKSIGGSLESTDKTFGQTK